MRAFTVSEKRKGMVGAVVTGGGSITQWHESRSFLSGRRDSLKAAAKSKEAFSHSWEKKRATRKLSGIQDSLEQISEGDVKELRI